MAGKITPSELKFTFQMKDEFDGVNPKHLVKRETQQGYNSGGGSYIGTCSHYWFVSSKQFSFFPFLFKSTPQFYVCLVIFLKNGFFLQLLLFTILCYVVICTMSSGDLLS